MCNVKRVKSAEIFPIVSEILTQGGHAWIVVTGVSMYPFLREDKDSVKLTATSFKEIKRGDIVLIKRETGEYVLHRVLRKAENSFYMIGDAQQWIEGPLMPKQLIAVVTAIKKGQSEAINCNNFVWKLLSGMWLNMIPLRHVVFKLIGVIRKVYYFFKRDNTKMRRNCETKS